MAETMMTDEEYATTVSQLMTLGALVRDLNAKGVLDRISRADTVGSLFNPTLYRKAMPKLDLIRKVAEGAVAFQAKLPTLQECTDAELHQQACERLEHI